MLTDKKIGLLLLPFLFVGFGCGTPPHEKSEQTTFFQEFDPVKPIKSFAQEQKLFKGEMFSGNSASSYSSDRDFVLALKKPVDPADDHFHWKSHPDPPKFKEFPMELLAEFKPIFLHYIYDQMEKYGVERGGGGSTGREWSGDRERITNSIGYYKGDRKGVILYRIGREGKQGRIFVYMYEHDW